MGPGGRGEGGRVPPPFASSHRFESSLLVFTSIHIYRASDGSILMQGLFNRRDEVIPSRGTAGFIQLLRMRGGDGGGGGFPSPRNIELCLVRQTSQSDLPHIVNYDLYLEHLKYSLLLSSTIVKERTEI